MKMESNDAPRILARSLARELTNEEMEIVSGGEARAAACTKSTCSASDNNSCDLDQCGDLE
jgi:hypothetical protein